MPGFNLRVWSLNSCNIAAYTARARQHCTVSEAAARLAWANGSKVHYAAVQSISSDRWTCNTANSHTTALISWLSIFPNQLKVGGWVERSRFVTWSRLLAVVWMGSRRVNLQAQYSATRWLRPLSSLFWASFNTVLCDVSLESSCSKCALWCCHDSRNAYSLAQLFSLAHLQTSHF